MRTTVDLPADLFRKAKSRAASRGESLKTLLTRAVAVEVAQARDAATRGRIALPVFGDRKGRRVSLHAADLARALADEDVGRVDRIGRRRR